MPKPLDAISYHDTGAERPCIKILRRLVFAYLALGWPLCALVDDMWSPRWEFKMTDIGAAIGCMAAILLWLLGQLPQLTNNDRMDQVEQHVRGARQEIKGLNKVAHLFAAGDAAMPLAANGEVVPAADASSPTTESTPAGQLVPFPRREPPRSP